MRRPTQPFLPPAACELVAARGGVITVPEAHAWGVPYPRIRRLVAAGRWVRVFGSVIAVDGVRPTQPWPWAWAARLATGGVVSHTLAAALSGLPAPPSASPDVHVIGPRRLHVAIPGVSEHRAQLRPDEVVGLGPALAPLAVTAPVRTVLDCLAWLPVEDARSLAFAAVQRSLVTVADLDAGLVRFRGRPGVRVMRERVDELRSGAHSVGEWRMHVVLHDAGIRGWEVNVPIVVEGRVVAIADLLVRGARLIIEFDGRRFHEGLDRRRYDRSRDRLLIALGYTVLRFDWADVVNHPERVVREILAVLARLEAERAVS